jgi:hypothetical protein
MSSPLRAASGAAGAVRSGAQRVGGDPHTRPRASQDTHFPSGPRYPGPPLSPQVASATEVAATSDTSGAITVCEVNATTHLPPQYDHLTSERGVLCPKSDLRLERRDQQDQEEAEQRDHRRDVRRFSYLINTDEVFGTHSVSGSHIQLERHHHWINLADLILCFGSLLELKRLRCLSASSRSAKNGSLMQRPANQLGGCGSD